MSLQLRLSEYGLVGLLDDDVRLRTYIGSIDVESLWRHMLLFTDITKRQEAAAPPLSPRLTPSVDPSTSIEHWPPPLV